MSSVEELKKNKHAKKGNIIVDSDYVLRDKKKEQKDKTLFHKNTRDITGNNKAYADKLKEIKAQARREAENDLKNSDFVANLTAEITKQVREELLKDTKSKPTTRGK